MKTGKNISTEAPAFAQASARQAEDTEIVFSFAGISRQMKSTILPVAGINPIDYYKVRT
jgi:hypothetical protein